MYTASLFRNILNILIWTALILLSIILYHYVTRSVVWNPDTLATIDTLYRVSQIFLITGLLASLTSSLFRQLRHSSVLDTKFLKRFFPLIRVFVTSMIWAIGMFLVLEAMHIDTKNILAGAGIGGAILALASKDLLTNLLGSLSILFSGAFEIGDMIRVRTVRLWIEGIVEEITLNHTKLTNNTGEVIYIPNKTIYTESVENLSRRRFFTYEYIVPFSKQSNAREVETALKIIEGKLSSYYPIDVTYVAENPNATDYVYRISMKIPEENTRIDTEIRNFLVEYIFSRNNAMSKS